MMIKGQPVLMVIDIQGSGIEDSDGAIPCMPDYEARMRNAPELIEKARHHNIPVIFFQEAHRRNLIDFGRELDGAEGIHLL